MTDYDAQEETYRQIDAGNNGAVNRASEVKTHSMSRTPFPAASGATPPPPRMDRYHITGVLGEGAMATVYEGHDTVLRRTVAIKVMKPDLAKDAEMCNRFSYEARLLAQMRHPGITSVFENVDPTDGSPFYVMEKVTGKTFRTLLRERPPERIGRMQETAEILHHFEELCEAVAYAHSRNIVHRDLKPQNIMVDTYNVVHVLDWGLSKRLNPGAAETGITETAPGIIKGTPAYMSPEQATGTHDDVDFRSDVFSLGAILYEILTGRLPFEGKTHTEVLTKIVEEEPEPPHRINRYASRVLAAICMKALNKDPALRYPTAKELAKDIRHYRDNLPVSAYRPRLRDRLRNWIGHHPALASAIGTGATLALLFGGFLYQHHSVAQVRRQAELQNRELARSMRAQHENDALNAMVAFMKELDKGIDGIDGQIVSLEKQRASAASSDEAAQHGIAAKLQELHAARDWNVDYGQIISENIMLFMSQHKDRAALTQDSVLLKSIRDLMLEDVKSLIEIGDYYTADNHAWRYLVQSRLIGWSESETDELLNLKRTIEAKLAEGQGPGFKPPNWEQYEPKNIPDGFYWAEPGSLSAGAPPA